MAGLDITRAVRTTLSQPSTSEIKSNSTNISAPLPAKTFCDIVAEEYDIWFRTTMAGVMRPSPLGLPALKPNLKSFQFSTWGSAFAAYWNSVIWIPPYSPYVSAVTVNAAAVGAQLQLEINRLLLTVRPKTSYEGPDSFAKRIADILSTYTTKLQVQIALSVSPYTTTVFVQGS